MTRKTKTKKRIKMAKFIKVENLKKKKMAKKVIKLIQPTTCVLKIVLMVLNL